MLRQGSEVLMVTLVKQLIKALRSPVRPQSNLIRRKSIDFGAGRTIPRRDRSTAADRRHHHYDEDLLT